MTGDEIPTDLSLSRRKAIALGCSTLATSSAGCSLFEASDVETTPEQTDPPADYNPIIPASVGLSTKTAEFRVDMRPYFEQYGELDVTVRIYDSPNTRPDKWTLIGKQRKQHNQPAKNYSVPLDTNFGYGQRYHFTVEVSGDGVSAPEQEYYRRGIYFPHHNVAKGGMELVRVAEKETGGRYYINRLRDWESIARPSEERWRNPNAAKCNTRYWFDSPNKEPFGNPSVPPSVESEVYDHENIVLTVLCRMLDFRNIGEQRGPPEGEEGRFYRQGIPAYTWFGLTIKISEWELLEAHRWNSSFLQGVERGADKGIEEAKKNLSPIELTAADETHGPYYASEAATPYEQFRRGIETGEFHNCHLLTFSAGRAVAKRVADQLESIFETHPGLSSLTPQAYYKANALKCLVGGGPATYRVRDDRLVPEESIQHLYYRIAKGRDTGIDCIVSTTLYAGIAAHLLDPELAVILLRFDDKDIGHSYVGIHDLPLPDRMPDYPWLARVETAQRGLPYVYDVDRIPEYVAAETVYGESTIGYKVDDAAERRREAGIKDSIPVNTNLPLNEDYEPDVNGEQVTPDEDPENLFEMTDVVQ